MSLRINIENNKQHLSNRSVKKDQDKVYRIITTIYKIEIAKLTNEN